MIWLLIFALAAQSPPDSPATRLSPDEVMNVVISGVGEPVVLIPGLLGSAYGFRHVVPLLNEAGYRAIVIEPLGFGTSARPAEADYSLAAQADRLGAVLDTLVDGPVEIVAHSISASIVYRLAYRRPDLVKGMISLEGGPSETLLTPSFKVAMKFAPLIRMLGPKAIISMVREKMIDASGDSDWVNDDVVREYTAGIASNFGATLDAFKAMAKSEEPELLRDRLDEVRCPVRLLLGAARHKTGPSEEAVALLAETIADFTVDSVPGAGHFIHEESPQAVVVAVEYLKGSETT